MKPTTIADSTSFTPVAVTIPTATDMAGLSRGKLRAAFTDGVKLPDGTTFVLAAVKHGSQTLIKFDQPIQRAGDQLLTGGLRQLLEVLPAYRPGSVTPEAVEMVVRRKEIAAEQRAARAEREAAAK